MLIKGMLITFSGFTWIFFGVFVALLYWLGGRNAVYGVLIGLPIVLILVMMMIARFFGETTEQRREY